MAMTATFTTFDGQIIEEHRGGTTTLLIPDTLGNVIERRTAAGAQTYTATYWPFGEVRTSTGSNPSPWGFCGIWGYFTGTGSVPLYVRARYYLAKVGRWLTVDPLWPSERAYGYSSSTPVSWIDYSGLAPRSAVLCPPGPRPSNEVQCTKQWNEYIYRYCNCNSDYSSRWHCDQLARQYFYRCKGIPGPGNFAPPSGGPGEVAPRRPSPELVLPALPANGGPCFRPGSTSYALNCVSLAFSKLRPGEESTPGAVFPFRKECRECCARFYKNRHSANDYENYIKCNSMCQAFETALAARGVVATVEAYAATKGVE